MTLFFFANSKVGLTTASASLASVSLFFTHRTERPFVHATVRASFGGAL